MVYFIYEMSTQNIKIIIIRHGEDDDRGTPTVIGKRQSHDIADVIKEKYYEVDKNTCIHCSPAKRTKMMGETMKNTLGLDNENLCINESLLSVNKTMSHILSCQTELMIIVTHKEVIPGLIALLAADLDLEISKEHSILPGFASGWVLSNEGLEKIEPKTYKTNS